MIAIQTLEGINITSLFDYLNQNNGAITVIFTAVVAIATVVYAILTWKLVSETRMMREVQTEPKISAIIQPKDYWLNFIEDSYLLPLRVHLLEKCPIARLLVSISLSIAPIFDHSSTASARLNNFGSFQGA